jgi:hypothetical protein
MTMFDGIRLDVLGIIRPKDRLWIEIRHTECKSIVADTVKSTRPRSFFMDFAVEVSKPKDFVAVRMKSSDNEDPNKERNDFLLIHAEPVSEVR